MPGMNSGLNSNNPALVAASRSALPHQEIIALLEWRSGTAGWSLAQTIRVTIPYRLVGVSRS